MLSSNFKVACMTGKYYKAQSNTISKANLGPELVDVL